MMLGIDDDDDGDDDVTTALLCTRAATGRETAHQPIFACRTCAPAAVAPAPPFDKGNKEKGVNKGADNDENDDEEGEESSSSSSPPPCVCQSCAEMCHDAHDVVYLGDGLCYCDCFDLRKKPKSSTSCVDDYGGNCACRLEVASVEAARRLGIYAEDEGGRREDDEDVCDCQGEINGCGGGGATGEERVAPIRRRQRRRRRLNAPLPLPYGRNHDCDHDGKNDVGSNSMKGYLHEVFTLPSLLSTCRTHDKHERCDDRCGGGDACNRLVRQAQALAGLSRDTFWVPGADDVDDVDDAEEEEETTKRKRCELEELALAVYRRHVEAYGLLSLEQDDDDYGDDTADEDVKVGREGVGGAEWWVQVKPVNLSPPSSSNDSNGGNVSSEEAVDLHYDKDEVLAETFQLGSFPTVSTVTYLTSDDGNDNDDECCRCRNNRGASSLAAAAAAAPTVLFPHAYENDDDDDPIPSMVVSHPIKGKHLVFDGRMLHGAPAHPALRRRIRRRDDDDDQVDGGAGTGCDRHRPDGSGGGGDGFKAAVRVTFLVNVWLTGKPAGVSELNDDIRSAVIEAASFSSSFHCDGSGGSSSIATSWLSPGALPFVKRAIDDVSVPLSAAIDGDETSSGKRVRLPFVSKGATWIDDDDDDGEAEDEAEDDLVLETYPPPLIPLVPKEGRELFIPSVAPFGDTVRVSFGAGSEARLVRLGLEDDDG